MRDLTFSAARELLAKNLTFCIYRYPKENFFHLAVDPELLSSYETDKKFLIRPFVPESRGRELVLDVVEGSFLEEHFLSHLNTLITRPEIKKALPPHTDQQVYFDAFEQYKREISEGRIEKAILSRVLLAEGGEDLDILKTLILLSERKPNAFVYFFQSPEAGRWMGATPELLLRQEAGKANTMALAGTLPYTEGQKYHWREKEREEQRLVSEHVENVFKDLGTQRISKKGPETIRSGNVVHLKTEYVFSAKNLTPQRIIEKLHPTPAIGGLPVKEALDCILKYENHDRQYYTGVIGETDFTDRAFLFVNLRCMQIGVEQIALYVGGGITKDSEREEEWAETELKGQLLMDILQSEVSRAKHDLIG